MMACLVLTTLYLSALAVCDIRTRTIPGWAPLLFGIAVSLLHPFLSDMTLPQYFLGLVPGAVLLLLSLIFRACLGTGDGLAVLSAGAAIGLEREFAALTAALIFCALVSVPLLLLKRVRRSDSLPFLPFLAASHLIMLAAGSVG